MGEESCWLCNNIGGIAVRNDATKWLNEVRFQELEKDAPYTPLFSAHELKSDTHSVHPCPACELAKAREEIAERDRRITDMATRWESHLREFDSAVKECDELKARLADILFEHQAVSLANRGERKEGYAEHWSAIDRAMDLLPNFGQVRDALRRREPAGEEKL